MGRRTERSRNLEPHHSHSHIRAPPAWRSPAAGTIARRAARVIDAWWSQWADDLSAQGAPCCVMTTAMVVLATRHRTRRDHSQRCPATDLRISACLVRAVHRDDDQRPILERVRPARAGRVRQADGAPPSGCGSERFPCRPARAQPSVEAFSARHNRRHSSPSARVRKAQGRPRSGRGDERCPSRRRPARATGGGRSSTGGVCSLWC